MTYRLEACDIDETYRYSLSVITESDSDQTLVVIQSNPSTASGSVADPTVGKVARWAEENQFATVIFLNLFAFISTDSSLLKNKPYEEIVGPRNDEVIRDKLSVDNCTVVLAWGKPTVDKDLYCRRLEEVKELIQCSGKEPFHVGRLTKGNYPRHGRSWNGDNRELRELEWSDILCPQNQDKNTVVRDPSNEQKHFLHSSFREKLIEHLLIGELLKLSWKNATYSLEVSKPEVDRQGYDLILEDSGFIRHVQLKTSHLGAKTRMQKVHTALADKSAGCVVWIYFDSETLELGPFLFFGGAPTQALPDLSEFKVARHTRGDAAGVKKDRPSIRVVPKSKFDTIDSLESLYVKLFQTPGCSD